MTPFEAFLQVYKSLNSDIELDSTAEDGERVLALYFHAGRAPLDAAKADAERFQTSLVALGVPASVRLMTDVYEDEWYAVVVTPQ